jgi:RNA polymerase sigma-70 factor, ECF subfamily
MDDLERLYKTHYAAVVRFLYRKIWDADRAEDLAQEVFIRAMAHRPEKPRAWIFAVAANLARDEARAAIRRKKHLTLLKDDPIPLSERDRDVLLLWDAGLSYPEIAAQTGLAVGAVGTTLARARKRLIEAHDRLDYQARTAHS